MKPLFYGGSFDPPHAGHLILPRDAMERFNFDKVVFIPAYLSPFKTKRGHRASPSDRLRMLELATEGVDYYSIDPYEIKKGGVSYTYDTVRYLKERYDLKKVPWLMGDDAFLSLKRWHRWRELTKLITPVVMLRNATAEEVLRFAREVGTDDLLLLNSRRLDLSSTEIRERIKRGLDARYMVPDRVWEYIRERGLYKDG